MESTLSAADVALLNDRQGMNGFGNGAWIWVFFLFILFAWGGFGRNGYGATQDGVATRAAVTEGFQFNQIDNGIRAIQNGICDATYALNSAIKDCCCEVRSAIQETSCATNRNIDALRYDMGRGFCDVTTAMNLNTRDLLEANNAGVQKILDKMCYNETEALKQQVNALQLSAIMQTQTSNIVNQIVPRPVPAYPVYVGYGYGYGNGYGFNNGCGCNPCCGCGV